MENEKWKMENGKWKMENRPLGALLLRILLGGRGRGRSMKYEV